DRGAPVRVLGALECGGEPLQPGLEARAADGIPRRRGLHRRRARPVALTRAWWRLTRAPEDEQHDQYDDERRQCRGDRGERRVHGIVLKSQASPCVRIPCPPEKLSPKALPARLVP